MRCKILDTLIGLAMTSVGALRKAPISPVLSQPSSEPKVELKSMPSRKHRFILNDKGDPDFYSFAAYDTDGDEHNGPTCLVCKRAACEHCVPEVYEEYCPGDKYDMSLLFAFERMPKGQGLKEYRICD